MEKYFRRTWVEVNLDALKHNYHEIESRLAEGSSIMAVVKADAYGHGVENTVREFSACGCRWFAVSNLEEALQVRSINGDCSILILGYTPPKYAQTLANRNISQAVFNSEYAEHLSQAALDCNVQVKIHVKVDTGMSRLGFLFHDSAEDIDSVEEIKRACKLPGLYPEGIFTHFASADEEEGRDFTEHQYKLFMTVIDMLGEKGIAFPLRHCCNSAATVLYPEMHLDLVRPGIILYGLMPSSFLRGAAPSSLLQGKIELKPALKMKTVVSMVKTIPAGTTVSYGRTYQSEKDMKIATVPIGYADGYPRALSGKAKLRIGNKLVPVIGRICMDQCMLDVSGIENIGEGFSVTVFDSDPDSPLSVDALAKKASTINYELICGINKRVPRVYTRHKEIEAIADYMK